MDEHNASQMNCFCACTFESIRQSSRKEGRARASDRSHRTDRDSWTCTRLPGHMFLYVSPFDVNLCRLNSLLLLQDALSLSAPTGLST